MRWLLVLALLLPACKERGTIDLDLSYPDECTAPTHAAVYLIRGALCGECTCGDCLTRCDEDNCTLGCDGDYCTYDELLAGVTVTPDRAGPYAVIYQLVTISETADGRDIEEVALLCADGVLLDKDGTSSDRISFAGTCCPLPAPDGGVADAGVPDAAVTDAGP